MPALYKDEDADLGRLRGRTVAVIGYGNQGRAQALNLRDSGIEVIIGNRNDEYREGIVQDGFAVWEIEDAVTRAEIVMLLIPDEVQGSVYAAFVAPYLRPNMTLDFGSGYNIHFGYIVPPKDVDVVLLGPRTVGIEVRSAFVRGSGAPADVAVWQDATGAAWPTVLALAKAIGATRSGALKTTFAEETELDLFSEQAFWPVILDCLLTAYDVLVSRGYSKEAILMELFASGEPADIFRAMATEGVFEQMKYHSLTSRYGALSHRPGAAGAGLRRRMESVLDRLQDGSFAREWAAENQAGCSRFESLVRDAEGHPINSAYRDLRKLFANTAQAGM
jgi:ketol-acid reductoisomerase